MQMTRVRVRPMLFPKVDPERFRLRAAIQFPSAYLGLMALAFLAAGILGEFPITGVWFLSMPIGLLGVLLSSQIHGEHSMMVGFWIPVLLAPIQWFIVGFLVDYYRCARSQPEAGEDRRP